MHDPANELLRISLLGTWVNKGMKKDQSPTKSGHWLFRGCLATLWLLHDSKLLHHAQLITVAPVLHNLALSNARDVYRRELYTVASRSDAHELPLVGAAPPHTSYYLVSLGDYVFYIYMEVGEGGMQ
jgi:hypothetical protein